MALTITAEQIIALAPDDASAKAGKGLATKHKWLTFGHNDQAIWGECQGSGKNPYQTEIDLSELAFRCTCPSRKFPCKHGIGLFLLLASDWQSLPSTDPPARVTEWLTIRAEKQAKKAAGKHENSEKNENSDTSKKERDADTAASQKRQLDRQSRVTNGLQDLARWLCDLMRRGLASVQAEPFSFWDSQAARLVDAQAAGIARMLREIAGISASGVGWQDRLLERIGKLHLLIEAYQQIEILPEPLQADIRALIGWAQSQDELLAQPGIRDRWYVLGQIVEEDQAGISPLRVQRIWLVGVANQRMALLLNFAHGRQPFEINLLTGSRFDAELVYYSGAYPLRALIKDRKSIAGKTINGNQSEQLSAHSSIESAMNAFTSALTVNPWIERFPLLLRQVVPVIQHDRWFIVDKAGHYLPISTQYQQHWQLLARSGGHPLNIFAEWNGDYLLPINILNI